jgi:hypothetical protein
MTSNTGTGCWYIVRQDPTIKLSIFDCDTLDGRYVIVVVGDIELQYIDGGGYALLFKLTLRLVACFQIAAPKMNVVEGSRTPATWRTA